MMSHMPRIYCTGLKVHRFLVIRPAGLDVISCWAGPNPHHQLDLNTIASMYVCLFVCPRPPTRILKGLSI